VRYPHGLPTCPGGIRACGAPARMRGYDAAMVTKPTDRRFRAPSVEAPGADDAHAAGAISYWLVASAAGPRRAVLAADETADIVIIGAGFSGLWTAIALTDTDPSLRVLVLEAETVGHGASGRNGGFCSASLTHGLANGIRHFPDELAILEREGVANLAALVAFTRDHGIDCDLEETGILDVADQPYQVD
jgi:hypothetical protein